MKIIKPGKNQAGWRRTVTCKEDRNTGCEAEFEVERADAFVENDRVSLGWTPFACCYCPSCGTIIRICDARPFLADLPNHREFKVARPEIVAEAEAHQALTKAAYLANPRGDSSGRGY